VALRTGVPRLAKMSTPAWVRVLPRGAPKVAAIALAGTPWTGEGSAVAGGIRLMRQSILGVSSNGCLQAHPAAKPSIARKIIGASTRRACRVGVAMSTAGCMRLKPACSAMSTRSMGTGWPEDRPQKHSGRLEAVPSR